MTTTTKPVAITCPACDGRFDADWNPLANDRLASEEEGYAAVCPACAGKLATERRNRSLPAGLVGLSFDSLERTGERGPAVEAAEQWGRGRSQGLLLYGPVGTGKTRTAATAANARLQWEPLIWVSVPELLVKALAAIDSDERKQAVKALTGRGTLVLDDLDKVKPSEWALSQLFLAIDQRVNAGTGLLVTTNRTPREIVETLGEPIGSRLAGYCDVRRMAGSDRRLS